MNSCFQICSKYPNANIFWLTKFLNNICYLKTQFFFTPITQTTANNNTSRIQTTQVLEVLITTENLR